MLIGGLLKMLPPPSAAGKTDMRRRAAVTDAELNRVLRVARKHGAQAVEVKTPDASFTVVLVDKPSQHDLHKATKPRPVM